MKTKIHKQHSIISLSRKIFLIVFSMLLLVNCKDDEESGSVVKNEIQHDGETYPILYLEALQQGSTLYFTGGNDNDEGFVIHFRDKTLETLDGVYIFNDDEDGYNPTTDFSGGFLNTSSLDAAFITSGQVEVDRIDENHIQFTAIVTAGGIASTVHYKGEFAH